MTDPAYDLRGTLSVNDGGYDLRGTLSVNDGGHVFRGTLSVNDGGYDLRGTLSVNDGGRGESLNVLTVEVLVFFCMFWPFVIKIRPKMICELINLTNGQSAFVTGLIYSRISRVQTRIVSSRDP